MELKKYYNKKVHIVSDEGKIFEGVVSDYIYPEDNESEKESIVIDSSNGIPIELYESDIKTIQIKGGVR